MSLKKVQSIGIILFLILSVVSTSVLLISADVFEMEENIEEDEWIKESESSESEPQWPMYQYDQQRSSRSPYTGPDSSALLWYFETEDMIKSSPAIASDGTIYVGSEDHNLYALHPDGTEKWRFTTGDVIRSSPTIGSDGTIYIGSGYWSGAQDTNLYAINPDGTEEWRFTTGAGVLSSPVIDDEGTIYVGSYDNNLYAINPDGSEKWSFNTRGDVRSAPAIGPDGTIYVGTWASNLYAINPDGSEKWSFNTDGPTHYSLGVGPDGTIYVGTRSPGGDTFYAIDPDGSERWRFSTGHQVWSSPAIAADGTIYVGTHDDNLYALNPDGSQKWSFATDGTIASPPVIDAEGTIYVGSYDHNFYALNPNGTEKWSFATNSSIFSAPAISSDGTIYVASNDYNLYAIGSGADSVSLTIDASEGGTTHPEPGTYTYKEGTKVSVEALPDHGYQFREWTGDHEEMEKEITITMDGDKEITAVFEKDTAYHELEVNIEGEGDVVVEPEQEDYEEGTEVELSAVPAEDWYFDGWTGDVESEEEEIMIIMDDDKEVTAVFGEISIPTYELTVNIEGEGIVEVDPEQKYYKEGTEVTLTAEPDQHWNFDKWTGDFYGNKEQITITMDDDKSVTARFVEHTYSLEVRIKGEGSVEIEPDKEKYEPGEEVGLTAVMDEGWHFVEWTGDLESTEEEITLVMDEDKVLTAKFEEVVPAYFEVEITGTDVEVIQEPGDPGLKVMVAIDYMVTNTGDEMDTQDIEFTVCDDPSMEVVYEDVEPEVTLDAGETHLGNFSWETNTTEHAGWYLLEVASEDYEDDEEVQIPSGGRFFKVKREVSWTGDEVHITGYIIMYEDKTVDFTFVFVVNRVGSDTVRIEIGGTKAPSINYTIEGEESYKLETGDGSSPMDVDEDPGSDLNYNWVFILLLVGIISLVGMLYLVNSERTIQWMRSSHETSSKEEKNYR